MSTIPQRARAIICPGPGSPSILRIESIPVPVPQPGQVLLRILGFGINRAEMYTRQGHSPGLKFPLILGIECIGRVVAYNNDNDNTSTTTTTTTTTSPPPSSSSSPQKRTHKIAFHPGDLVATCMGGLGRQIPGSYQEYTCVPAANLRAIPLPQPSTAVTTSTLAALPEMFQTAWGALTAGLDVQPGDSVLVRGATSSIGLCALQLLKVKLGASRVGATTRNPERVGMLRDAGADVVFIDDNENKIAHQVANGNRGAEGVERDGLSEGTRFDKCLELTGTKTLLDSAACLKPKGTVCMTGIQGGEWELERFSPMAIPNRVRVCGYGGGPEDFHAMPWEELVNDVVEGRINVPVKEYSMEDIQTIHENMEAGGGGAKMVVVLGDL